MTYKNALRAGSGLLACTVVLLGAVACSGGGDDGGRQKAAAPTSRPTGTPTGTPSPKPSAELTGTTAGRGDGGSVTTAPKPVDGTALISVASRTGSAALPLGTKLDKGWVGVQVDCLGKGTLKVSLAPVGLAFDLTCFDGKVNGTYSRLDLRLPREVPSDEAVVQVTAPSTVRWALTAEH